MIECNYKSPAKISDETFEEIYNRIKTPYKYGAVIKFDDHMADSPTVFKYNGKWYQILSCNADFQANNMQITAQELANQQVNIIEPYYPSGSEISGGSSTEQPIGE